jgi:hypothetical protein
VGKLADCLDSAAFPIVEKAINPVRLRILMAYFIFIMAPDFLISDVLGAPRLLRWLTVLFLGAGYCAG